MKKHIFLSIPLVLLIVGCNTQKKAPSSNNNSGTTLSSEIENSSFNYSSNNPSSHGSISQAMTSGDSGSYYDGIDSSKSGDSLRSDLYDLIKISSPGWSYSGLWEAYKTTDKRPNGTVWDIYSDQTQYQFGQKQCGNYKKEGDCWNKEHMIPQSVFNEASPMKSDAHHVLPSDGKVNNERGTLPHGNVATPNYTSIDGCKRGTSSDSGYTGTVFEPLPQYKGDTARIYFYFVTCYMNRISGYSYSAFQGNNLAKVFIEIYLEWHLNDEVSAKEVTRNQAIYDVQHNRNPYIDHPEYACKIWGNTSDKTRSLCGIN